MVEDAQGIAVGSVTERDAESAALQDREDAASFREFLKDTSDGGNDEEG